MKWLWLGAALMGLWSETLAVEDKTVRYRGEYILGHEVNTFCPHINSQCYWLGSYTGDEEREVLRRLSVQNRVKPYDAVCVVIEGIIHKKMDEHKNDGFAADYDGTIDVDKVYGLCSETDTVTEGDLQHHRWILESVNGQKIDIASLHHKIPELDFGESMYISGTLGCNRYSGQARLDGESFYVDKMVSTRMMCAPQQNTMEQVMHTLLGKPSKITLDADKNLILRTEDILLLFRLKEWVH